MSIDSRKLTGRISRVLVLGIIAANTPHSLAADMVSAGEGAVAAHSRHGRGHHPPRGGWAHTLPPANLPYHYRGRPFYFYDGFWYERRPGGYFAVRPPLGLYVPVPPPSYTTIWIGGVPYHYSNGTYYRWADSRNAYEIFAPPPRFDALQPAPPVPPTQESAPLSFVYPRNGQSAELQSADRYECHTWSKGQTGFDPTQAGGGVPADERSDRSGRYQRALNACLEERGYSVR